MDCWNVRGDITPAIEFLTKYKEAASRKKTSLKSVELILWKQGIVFLLLRWFITQCVSEFPPFTLSLVWYGQVEVPPHKRPQCHSHFKTFGYFQKSSRKKVPCCLGNVSRLNWFAWTDFGRVQRLQYRSRRGYGHWIWDISFTDHLLRANCMLCLLRSQGRMLHECYSSFSAERAFFSFFFFSQRYTGVHQKLPPLPFINWKCVEELSWTMEKHANMQTMFPLMGLLNAQLDIHSLKINLN